MIHRYLHVFIEKRNKLFTSFPASTNPDLLSPQRTADFGPNVRQISRVIRHWTSDSLWRTETSWLWQYPSWPDGRNGNALGKRWVLNDWHINHQTDRHKAHSWRPKSSVPPDSLYNNPPKPAKPKSTRTKRQRPNDPESHHHLIQRILKTEPRFTSHHMFMSLCSHIDRPAKSLQEQMTWGINQYDII